MLSFHCPHLISSALVDCGTLTNGQSCDLRCDERQEYDNDMLRCSSASPCNIECSEYQASAVAKMGSNGATNVHIECSGEGACYVTHVDARTAADVSILCYGTGACTHADICRRLQNIMLSDLNWAVAISCPATIFLPTTSSTCCCLVGVIVVEWPQYHF